MKYRTLQIHEDTWKELKRRQAQHDSASFDTLIWHLLLNHDQWEDHHGRHVRDILKGFAGATSGGKRRKVRELTPEQQEKLEAHIKAAQAPMVRILGEEYEPATPEEMAERQAILDKLGIPAGSVVRPLPHTFRKCTGGRPKGSKDLKPRKPYQKRMKIAEPAEVVK